MSRPHGIRLAAAVGVATVALLAATPARPMGQGGNTVPDSLLARVRMLDATISKRTAVIDSMRRSLVRVLPPVEVRHGPFYLRTTRRLEQRVRAAVVAASAQVDARGSKAIASRIASRAPVVAPDSARAMFGMVPIIAISSDTSRRWSPIGRSRVPSTASVAELSDALVSLAEQLAVQGADSSLAAWIMVGRIPIRAATADEWGDAYVELATTESAALRRCRAGDVASCLDALGVDSVPGPRIDRWYAPSDYRAVLRHAAPPGTDSVAVATWIRCRRLSDQPACATVAKALPEDRVPSPLSGAARLMFLREVLDAGGPGAYDRLLGTSGPMRSRLATASNEPLDATVARWLAHLERARPDRMRLSPGLVLASLGWCGALIGLTLIRRASWV